MIALRPAAGTVGSFGFVGKELGLLAALFCVAALALGFGLLADEVMEGDTMAFGTRVARFLRPVGAAGPVGPAWLHEMARDVTALGSMVVLVLPPGECGRVPHRGPQAGAAILLLGPILGGTVVSFGLKLLFKRPCPEIPGGIQVFTASFPAATPCSPR